MKIDSYTVADLPTILEREPFCDGGEIPISPLRAQAQFHNPRAEKTDVVLWCMFEADELIAYRLVFPDHLYLNGEVHKIAWLSCLWVDPVHRGKGFGKQLTRLALTAWRNKIAFVNAAPASLSLYSNMVGCNVLYENIGMRYYFSSDLATVLPIKHKVFKSVDFLLKPIDQIMNSFLSYNYDKGGNNASYTLLDRITDEAAKFIDKQDKLNLMKRGKREFDWLVDHPWVIESSEENPLVERYHFSLQHPVYQDYYIQVKDGGEVMGLLLLKNKNQHFTVHYVWAEESGLEHLAHAVLSVLTDHKPKSLSVYDEDLVLTLEKISFRYLHKKVTRQTFMAYSGVPKASRDRVGLLQYGDGDTVFT